MGERVTRITATAFRGVPDVLAIDLEDNGRSLVVFGDNGTGKSTIADALEWYFRGHIDFLRHEGRQQAVRHLAAPKDVTTTVAVETTGVLGGTVTYPYGVPPESVLNIGSRETFLLRGRTLVEFVEKPKAEKWRALTQILGLDAVDQLRLNLQRAKNELEREYESAATNLATQSSSMASRVRRVDEDGILAAIRGKCAEADVEEPATLDVALDPAWAQSVIGRDKAVGQLVQLTSLASELQATSGFGLNRDAVDRWNTAVTAMPAADRQRLALFRAAEVYVGDVGASDECPLCGQAIALDTLVARVRGVVMGLMDASNQIDEATSALRRVARAVTTVDDRMAELGVRATQLGVELPVVPSAPNEPLQLALNQRIEIDIERLEWYARESSAWLAFAAQVVADKVPSPTSDTRAALIELGALAADARNWRLARRACAAAQNVATVAERVFAAYQSHQREYVEEILRRISERVAIIYEKLHPGEGLQGVWVELWTDKGIELVIDFHGRKQRPPHGVLSESHLNSLAIALFLAMAQTFNEHLNFLVLDDVVNSFDIDHRGNLAKLLAEDFSDWQLVVLTHDHQFYEHVRRRVHGWACLEFTSWTFENGPRKITYETGSMLEKAATCLPDDVTGAAQKGRRALEELLQEICERLEAPLPFHRGARNDRRELGELFAGVRRCLKDVAKPLLGELQNLLTDLEADVGAALNVESHASRGRASAQEVRTALDRIRQLDNRWSCPDCGTRIWHTGTPDASRCKCGKSHFPP